MDADLDTLATALYVRTDDLLKASPERVPWRPAAGITPRISDAELVTLAVLQALPRFTSRARWLRHARDHLRHLFPYLPAQPGYNKRLRRLADTAAWLIGVLARDTSPRAGDAWVVDSTPVECGRSRETARRSDLAAEYGYCASHSRFFRGLRPHILPGILDAGPDPAALLPGQILIGDKNYLGADFEATLDGAGISLLRPARKRRGQTARITVLQATTADRRVGLRHLQRPARPRSPRRTDANRSPDPRPAAHPRPHRSHLA